MNSRFHCSELYFCLHDFEYFLSFWKLSALAISDLPEAGKQPDVLQGDTKANV